MAFIVAPAARTVPTAPVAPPQRAGLAYRAEIDGLRAFAVVPVILFHAGVPPFSGGYVGVDVFFVISGYLITTLIAGALAEGRFSLLDFYERRARRILPALFLVMAACIPFAWLWMLPTQRLDFFQSLVAVNLFGSNGLFWAEDSYFGLASEAKPLLHTWSLAVEEQFYVVFPLLLMVAMGRGRGVPWRLVAGLTMASFVACLWAVSAHPTAAFYLTPFRAWELGVGALAGFALMARPMASETGAALGLGAILVSVLLLRPETPFPSEWALLPVFGTVLVVLFAGQGTWVARFLSWRPLVWIGLLSYSAYLWHQPLFAFARVRLGVVGPEVTAGLIAATFVLALLSWRFVEQPIRRGASLSRGMLFSVVGAVAALFLAVGFWGTAKDGFPGRFDQLDLAGYRWDNQALGAESWGVLPHGYPGQHVGHPGDDLPSFANDGRPRLLVLGNSHSKDLFNALHFLPGLAERAEIARYGAQIHTLTPDHRFWQAPNYRDADVVLIASRYQKAEQGGEDLPMVVPVVRRILGDGKRAVIVGNTPTFPFFSGRSLADLRVRPHLRAPRPKTFPALADDINALYWDELDGPDQVAVDVTNATLREIAADLGVPFLDRMDYMCDRAAGRCFALGPDLAKYHYDGHHITLDGAAFFGARMGATGWLDPVLE